MSIFRVGVVAGHASGITITPVNISATRAAGRVVGVATEQIPVNYSQPRYVVELWDESKKIAEFWEPSYWFEVIDGS